MRVETLMTIAAAPATPPPSARDLALAKIAA